MEEIFLRFWSNLLARVHGPLSFRFVLQPLMASLLALRAGLQDAERGRPPYLWTMLTDKTQRHALLLEWLKTGPRVFLLAIAIDAVYQLVVLRWIYPLEMLAVALVLAVLPYLVLRGPVNRIATIWHRKKTQKAHTMS
jgi:hypothetical protein